jgi:hypothetical protein
MKSLKALHLLHVVKQVNGGLWLKENEFMHPSLLLNPCSFTHTFMYPQIALLSGAQRQHFVYFLLVT